MPLPRRVKTLPDGKICDFIDGTIRNDTDEEYVRQNIERRLVRELGYSPTRIAVEFPIKMASTVKRADIVLFPEGAAHSQEHIEVIIECKRDATKPTDKKDGEEQLKSYMSACPNAVWGMWTNGRYKSVFKRVVDGHGRYVWEEPNDIPSGDGSTEYLDRPQRATLMKASDDNLLFSFRMCHDRIYVTEGMQKQPAFFELLKIIFCKISDERNLPHPLEFYATSEEKKSNDGRLSVKNRISKIFSQVKKRYPAIFDANDELKLDPRSLAPIVSELQRYSFLDTNIDVKGKAYEELVGANLRGDRGEFFTPRNIQRMVIQMLDLRLDERILDPSCGTGGFLVIAMNECMEKLRQKSALATLHDEQRLAFHDRVRELAAQCFFGFDINPDLVKATKMNMVMNNDGSGNILRTDSLLHPYQWSTEFRAALAQALKISPEDLRGPRNLAHFDVIATNPPFGAKLPITDTETLSQYDLGHVWEYRNHMWERTSTLQSSIPNWNMSATGFCVTAV